MKWAIMAVLSCFILTSCGGSKSCGNRKKGRKRKTKKLRKGTKFMTENSVKFEQLGSFKNEYFVS